MRKEKGRHAGGPLHEIDVRPVRRTGPTFVGLDDVLVRDFLDVLLRLREEGTAGLELTDDRIKSIIKVIVNRSHNLCGFNFSANDIFFVWYSFLYSGQFLRACRT